MAAAVIILVFSTAGNVLAHCDTLDGPVVTVARRALEKKDVNIVLPWVAADEAFESGDPKRLLALINEAVRGGIHKYCLEAKEKKVHAGGSVEAGRGFVRAYVSYLHFVERLYEDAMKPIAHGEGEGGHAQVQGHPQPARAAQPKHAH